MGRYVWDGDITYKEKLALENSRIWLSCGVALHWIQDIQDWGVLVSKVESIRSTSTIPIIQVECTSILFYIIYSSFGFRNSTTTIHC